MFTRALHWSLSWVRSIQSISSHPISLEPILLLSSRLPLGLYVSLCLAFPAKSYMHSLSLPHACCTSCLSHPHRLDHSNNTWRRVQVMKHFVMQILRPLVTSFLFGQIILIGTLFINTLSLRSSLNVRDQVSQPYRTTCHNINLKKKLSVVNFCSFSGDKAARAWSW
jgi:hypothetical protein